MKRNPTFLFASNANRVFMQAWFLFLVGIVCSFISLDFFPLPWIFIAICWSSLFIILTLRSNTPARKGVWFNLAVIVVLFGVLEIYAYLGYRGGKGYFVYNEVRYEGGYMEGYFVSNDILGYGPDKDRSITSKKFHGDKQVYDVTYTIGKDGLRITPPGSSYYNDECIISFGGSFAFGEGVNDRDSMPYVVGTLQGRKTHNFGFHGYGPHQMLAAIENGMIHCKPKFAIYQAITGHVIRSAGYSAWDTHGPKYVMKNRHLTYSGSFDDWKNVFPWGLMISRLEKSYFYKRFFRYFIHRYITFERDIQLFIEIVDASRRRLTEEFADVEFYVILWDNLPDDNTYLKIKEGFESRSIRYDPVSDMLPGFFEDAGKYEIDHDGHPTSTAHRLIAKYVVENIIGD